MKYKWLFALGSVTLLLTVSGCAHTPKINQHTIKKGETAQRIAHRYGVTLDKLASLNGWADIGPLLPRVGDSTVRHVKLSAPRVGTPRVGIQKITKEASSRLASSGQENNHLKKAAYGTQTVRFIWPLQGKLSSKFGRRWGTMHNGIDISAHTGAPIKASASGTVIHSGRELGYGKLLIVYHGRGYSTVYAHLSKIKMKKGQKVKRGQFVAWAGSTGRSTGPHLHFEIRKYKDAQNPLYYLP